MLYNNHRRKTFYYSSMKRYTPVLILLAFMLPGCSLWDDFTTYFNLYYNTTDIFSQAEQIIMDQRKDPFSLLDLPVPATATGLLNKVIEKCSKILQFNSKGSFVDNSLMMLGKSFYYQKSYIKAQRKFQELITAHPESDLVIDAELWQAKTEMQMKDFVRGLSHLTSVIAEAQKAERSDILSDAYVEETKYFIGKEDYDKAIELCLQIVKVSKDNTLNARALFTSGDLYQKLGRYKEAVTQYESVNGYSPTYDIAYEARLRYGKMLLNLQKHEEALNVFTQLRMEDKFKEFNDITDLSIGIALREMGKYDEAYRQFSMYDTTYAASVQIGGARYELGVLYEHAYKNYDSCSVYYQKALSSTATAEYLPLIREKSQIFIKYNGLVNSYNDYQRQYFYALYPEEFTKDSLKFVQDTTTVKKEVAAVAEKQDSVNAPAEIRSERERNFDELVEKAFANSSTISKSEAKKAPKSPVLSADSLKTLLAKNVYDLGSMFLTDLNIPDSAGIYYNLGLSSFPGTVFSARTLFALGNYYLIMNDTVKADSIYSIIYDQYKTDKIVNEAAARLNKPLIDFDFDPAKGKYAEVEKLLIAKDYKNSLTGFYSIYKSYPKSTYAAKSLLAAGYILEDKLFLSDSAAVVYDTLMSNFPSSQYAQKIAAKLDFYKLDKASIRKAKADSLMAISDSLKKTDTTTVFASGSTISKDGKSQAVVSDSLASVKPLLTRQNAKKADSIEVAKKKVFINDEDIVSIKPKQPGTKIVNSGIKGKDSLTVNKMKMEEAEENANLPVSKSAVVLPTNAVPVAATTDSLIAASSAKNVKSGTKDSSERNSSDLALTAIRKVKENSSHLYSKEQQSMAGEKLNRQTNIHSFILKQYYYFGWKANILNYEDHLVLPPLIF